MTATGLPRRTISIGAASASWISAGRVFFASATDTRFMAVTIAVSGSVATSGGGHRGRQRAHLSRAAVAVPVFNAST